MFSVASSEDLKLAMKLGLTEVSRSEQLPPENRIQFLCETLTSNVLVRTLMEHLATNDKTLHLVSGPDRKTALRLTKHGVMFCTRGKKIGGDTEPFRLNLRQSGKYQGKSGIWEYFVAVDEPGAARMGYHIENYPVTPGNILSALRRQARAIAKDMEQAAA